MSPLSVSQLVTATLFGFCFCLCSLFDARFFPALGLYVFVWACFRHEAFMELVEMCRLVILSYIFGLAASTLGSYIVYPEEWTNRVLLGMGAAAQWAFLGLAAGMVCIWIFKFFSFIVGEMIDNMNR